MRFTLEIRMRPIRIAFLVPPNDPKAVWRAIGISSFLWGGHLNPIIPLIKRTPKHYRDPPLPSPSAKQVLNGYIDAFDPDFITCVNCKSTNCPGGDFREVIDSDKILPNLAATGTSSYGIGYYELAQHVGHEEMRFQRKDPLHMVAPPIKGDFRIFFAAVLGSLPDEIAEDVDKQLKDAYNAPNLSVSLDTFATCLDRTFLTPIRLAKYKLKPDPLTQRWQRNVALYLDAGNLLDVIDFWNLRALGFRVFPLPKQAASQSQVIDALKHFARENHAVSRHHPEITFNVRLLRGRSIPESEFDEFVSVYSALKDLSNSPARPSIQKWFPRFWDQWSREHNECDCIRFFGDSSEIQVTAENEMIRFDPLLPAFDHSDTDGLTVANEVLPRTYSEGEPIAQVFPQAHEKLGAALMTSPFRHEWRFSAVRPVHFPRFRSSASIGVPKSQRLVEQWFTCDGWKVSTSQAGLAARELISIYLKTAIGDFGITL